MGVSQWSAGVCWCVFCCGFGETVCNSFSESSARIMSVKLKVKGGSLGIISLCCPERERFSRMIFFISCLEIIMAHLNAMDLSLSSVI